MKIKSYILFIVIINIFMIACSNNQNMLVGKWKLVNTSSPQRMNKSLEKGLIWEFNEDNTYTSSSFEGVISQGGWRAEGSILYMTDAGIADKDNTVGEMEMIKLTEDNLTVRISNGHDWIDLMFQKMIE